MMLLPFMIVILGMIIGAGMGVVINIGWIGLSMMGAMAAPTNDELRGVILFSSAATPCLILSAICAGLLWSVVSDMRSE